LYSIAQTNICIWISAATFGSDNDISRESRERFSSRGIHLALFKADVMPFGVA
jgi:hypothetical protein